MNGRSWQDGCCGERSARQAADVGLHLGANSCSVWVCWLGSTSKFPTSYPFSLYPLIHVSASGHRKGHQRPPRIRGAWSLARRSSGPLSIWRPFEIYIVSLSLRSRTRPTLHFSRCQSRHARRSKLPPNDNNALFSRIYPPFPVIFRASRSSTQRTPQRLDIARDCLHSNGPLCL